MESFYLLALIILVLFCHVVYRLKTQKLRPMALDKGGFFKGETICPDFSRKDLIAFLNECEENSIDNNLAKEFVIAVYNVMTWGCEPMAPRLNDSRYELWDLDEEVEDIINYIFKKHNINPVRWNNKVILNLVTFKDLLLYMDKKIKNANQ